MTDNRTTELREKLDKLGIEHLDSDLPNNKQTRWNKGAGGWGACYVEITHGSILPADSIINNRTLRIYDCTPEQAIAATLGSGTCEMYHVDTIEEICARADKRINELREEYDAGFAAGKKAAMLGSGTLTAKQVSKATYAHSIHADCADADWQAIADELNAELGSGTCEFVECGICKFYHADIQLCEYGIPPCSKFERKAVER